MAIIGESYTPQEKPKSRQLPKIPPSAAFQYAHHPRKWQIVYDTKGAHVVPSLAKIYYRPGTNHITNNMDLTECRMRYEADGWRFIPFDLAKKAEKGATSYLQRIKVQGGEAFLSRWCRVVPGTSRVMSDHVGWRRFLNAVARYVDPAPVWALDDLKTQYDRKRSELARTARMIPDAEEKIERVTQALKVIERELKKAEAREMKTGEEVIPDAVD
jgi:hypothetical protein